MFPSRILLPLDGSELSECGLQLAGLLGPTPELTFLQVVPPTNATVPSPDLRVPASAATEYLQRLSAGREGSNTKVLVRHADDTAQEILQVVEEGRHDLVALMTRGQGALRRWIWGSVATKLVRQSRVPLLIGNPSAVETLSSPVRRILVPLDGSATSAGVLDPVAELARSLEAEVLLFTADWVEPTPNAAAFAIALEDARRESEANLARSESLLHDRGVRTRVLRVRSYPAEAILEAVIETETDLVAMTTHGRTGVKRWVLGSVAEKVLRACPRPVYLARALPAA